MVRDRIQSRGRPAAYCAVTGCSLLTAILCIGCANPGPPKPPSLRLPALAKDLSAERVGDHVLLRWTTPTRTTDDQEIKGSITAEICREAGTRPLTPAARLVACAPVRRLAVTPGASEVSDTLPAAFQKNPVILLTYRVQLYNATSHSAGESDAVFAAAGAPPAAVSSLRATASERGAVLEWNNSSEWNRSGAPDAQGTEPEIVDLNRVDLTPHAAIEKKSKPQAKQASEKSKPAQSTKAKPDKQADVHLRAPESSAAARNATAGTVDTTAQIGDTYSYIAERVRPVTLVNHALEIHSDPSPPVMLSMRDTFPPKVPTGLATISGLAKADPAAPDTTPAATPLAYVDLSWEPNGESDLAGYRVYRQLARPDGSPQGPLARLTESPITSPTYRDVAVKPGQGYIYSVTAVDAAGNESAPSAKALEVVQSPQ